MKKLFVNTANTIRRQMGFLTGQSHDGNRDIYSVFGYTRNRTFSEYYNMFRLSGFANRVVAGVPRSCWRSGVEVKNKENDLFLENELKILTRIGFFRAMERADILNRIGRFSVLYVGIPDGMDTDKPIGKMSKGRMNEIFFQPYAFDGVEIVAWDQEPTSSRCGMPEKYQLQLMDRGDNEKEIKYTTRVVHWSRIVHLVEGELDSNLEGLPYMEPIFNRLLDIDKVTGGAAEAYFRNARGKVALESHKDYKGYLTDPQRDALRDEAEAFNNNWRDYMRLTGIEAKPINTPHYDPTGTFNAAVEEVSGYTGTPIRLLLGRGSGQLAGNEDKLSYNQIVSDRQNVICSGWVYNVFAILNMAGLDFNIPDDYELDWPLSEIKSDNEEADVMVKKSSAMKNVADSIGDMGGLSNEITAEQAVTEILGLKYEPGTDTTEDTDMNEEDNI